MAKKSESGGSDPASFRIEPPADAAPTVSTDELSKHFPAHTVSISLKILFPDMRMFLGVATERPEEILRRDRKDQRIWPGVVAKHLRSVRGPQRPSRSRTIPTAWQAKIYYFMKSRSTPPTKRVFTDFSREAFSFRSGLTALTTVFRFNKALPG
jgi:hypothetical protein